MLFREAMAVYYEKLEPIFNTQTIWEVHRLSTVPVTACKYT